MAGPLFLGIEIGGTKLQLGLGRGDGEIVAIERREVEPARGASGLLDAIAECLETLLSRTGRGRPTTAGIGFGGPVDTASGVILKSNHVSGWDGFPLAAWVMRTLSIPLAVLQNDSDVAALAEARCGAGRGFSPMLYVNSGSGVGGGLILDGRIHRGGGRGAVEIGHVVLGDPANGVGKTLEEIASGWAIARAGREAVASGLAGRDGPLALACGGRAERVTGEMVGRAALDADDVAGDILDRAAQAMGAAIALAVNLIAPSRVVLGGGVAQLPEQLWLEPIQMAAMERVYRPLRDSFEIVRSRFGQDVVVHGALATAADAWKMLSSG